MVIGAVGKERKIDAQWHKLWLWPSASSLLQFLSEAEKVKSATRRVCTMVSVLIQGANAHLNAYRLNAMIMKNQE